MPADRVIVVPVVAGIGNALLATPMLRRLLEALPQSRLIALARTPAMAEVIDRLNHFAAGRVTTHTTGSGFAGFTRMIRLARAARPDVYLVPFPSNRWQYNILAATSRARRRIMHAYPVGKWRTLGFLPATRIDAVRGLHDVDQNTRLLTALNIRAENPEAPAFPLTAAERNQAAATLRAISIYDPFIVIHAGSADTVIGAAKRWPTGSYAALIQKILDLTGSKILLVEGPDEPNVIAQIAAAMPPSDRVASLRLTGPLATAAAVLSHAQLYVGSDSGLAHLAAAVGIRAVTLFAAADPGRVCPWGNRDLVVHVNKSCSPCLRYPWSQTYPQIGCGPVPCVNEITVEQVLATVRRALSAAPVGAAT